MNMPPNAPPPGMMPRQQPHMCFSGSLSCSGCVPCDRCMEHVRTYVLSAALRAVGLNQPETARALMNSWRDIGWPTLHDAMLRDPRLQGQFAVTDVASLLAELGAYRAEAEARARAAMAQQMPQEIVTPDGAQVLSAQDPYQGAPGMMPGMPPGMMPGMSPGMMPGQGMPPGMMPGQGMPPGVVMTPYGPMMMPPGMMGAQGPYGQPPQPPQQSPQAPPGYAYHSGGQTAPQAPPGNGPSQARDPGAAFSPATQAEPPPPPPPPKPPTPELTVEDIAGAAVAHPTVMGASPQPIILGSVMHVPPDMQHHLEHAAREAQNLENGQPKKA